MRIWLSVLLAVGGCDRPASQPQDGGPPVIDVMHPAERGVRDSGPRDHDGGGRVDVVVLADGPNNCTALRGTGTVQVLENFTGDFGGVFATKSGGTIVVRDEVVTLFDGGQKSVRSMPGLLLGPTFTDDRLAVADLAGTVSIFDARLNLVQTLPYTHCRKSMFLVDRDHLACSEDLSPGGAKWRVYDLTTKKLVQTTQLTHWFSRGVWLRRMGAEHIVGSDGWSFALMKLRPDWSLEWTCQRSTSLVAIVVDAGAGELFVSTGQILKVFGTQCPWGNSDYFEPVGTLGFVKTMYPGREDIVTADDDGTDFLAVARDSETSACRLVKAHIESRQLLRSSGLPSLQVAGRAAYSPTCGYLAVDTRGYNGSHDVTRLWLP